MAAYWKSPLKIAWWPNDDINKYIQTEWDDLDYAVRSTYLSCYFLGLLTMRNLLPYQREDDEYMSQQYISAISLLYAIRKPDDNLHMDWGDKYQLIFVDGLGTASSSPSGNGFRFITIKGGEKVNISFILPFTCRMIDGSV